MTPLENFIKTQIREAGPMDVARFMTLALCHPEHGYYTRGEAFGADGDFTTAPEISQMFGEIIGVWAADLWQKSGAPDRFTLLECGPGRGTLMVDLLRGTKNVAGFHEALSVHMVEVSPALREKQVAALRGVGVTHHDTIASVPDDAPVIVIANEFLDALPVRQLVWQDGAWHERVLGLDDNDGLIWGVVQADPLLVKGLPGAVEEGAVLEIAPAREAFIRDTADLLKQATGAALFIDYGYDANPAYGDTLQAVQSHEPVSLLQEIGRSDLTAHVDFSSLAQVAQGEGLQVTDIITQGDFLRRCGIEQRAQALIATGGASEQVESALQRLTTAEQMGALFKVMGISYGG